MAAGAKQSTKPKASAARGSSGTAAVSTVSTRNQVTLPADVRSAAGIKAGSKVVITPLSGGRILIREKTGGIADLRGAALSKVAKRPR